VSGRRALGGAVAVVTMVAALFTWWHYYPSSPLIARLGLPGPRADTERHCGRAFFLYWRRVRVPTGDIICRSVRGSMDDFWKQEEVDLDPLTRRVTHGRRALVPVDSLSWAAARDSIRHAMSRGGGRPLPCYPPYDKEPPWILSEEAWRFPGYTVRLVAYHWIPRRTSTGPPTWLLQLDGYPGDPPGCGDTPPIRPSPGDLPA
jgi:hypothetical protein